MEAVRIEDLIREVPAKFSERYKHYPKDHRFPASAGGGSVGEIEAAFAKAGTSVEAIKAILPSWCEQTCDECGSAFDVLMRFGDKPDYEARWQDLCADCISKGLSALTAVEPDQ